MRPFLSICDGVMASVLHLRYLLVEDGSVGGKKYSKPLQYHLGTMHALFEKNEKGQLSKVWYLGDSIASCCLNQDIKYLTLSSNK